MLIGVLSQREIKKTTAEAQRAAEKMLIGSAFAEAIKKTTAEAQRTAEKSVDWERFR